MINQTQDNKQQIKEFLLSNGFKYIDITNRYYKTLNPSNLAGIDKEQISIFIRKDLSLGVKFIFHYHTNLGNNTTGQEQNFNNLEELKNKYPKWF